MTINIVKSINRMKLSFLQNIRIVTGLLDKCNTFCSIQCYKKTLLHICTTL